jgi:FlaA1/EpsC-like NDP-sugar epimerase
MKNVAIFGCGLAGQRAYKQLKSRYFVVTFLDNDSAKHDQRLFGIPISNPDTYDYSQVDVVFIASMYLDEILVQLLGLDVPSTKIDYVSDDTSGKAYAQEPFLLSAVRRASYLPFRLLR